MNIIIDIITGLIMGIVIYAIIYTAIQVANLSDKIEAIQQDIATLHKLYYESNFTSGP